MNYSSGIKVVDSFFGRGSRGTVPISLISSCTKIGFSFYKLKIHFNLIFICLFIFIHIYVCIFTVRLAMAFKCFLMNFHFLKQEYFYFRGNCRYFQVIGKVLCRFLRILVQESGFKTLSLFRIICSNRNNTQSQSKYTVTISDNSWNHLISVNFKAILIEDIIINILTDNLKKLINFT